MEPIAIIGMAGRFPGAANVGQLWANLREGVESISDLSTLQLLRSGVAKEVFEDPVYVARKGVLKDAEYFDAGSFR